MGEWLLSRRDGRSHCQSRIFLPPSRARIDHLVRASRWPPNSQDRIDFREEPSGHRVKDFIENFVSGLLRARQLDEWQGAFLDHCRGGISQIRNVDTWKGASFFILRSWRGHPEGPKLGHRFDNSFQPSRLCNLSPLPNIPLCSQCSYLIGNGPTESSSEPRSGAALIFGMAIRPWPNRWTWMKNSASSICW
jgi:hypothetical protein